MAHLETPTRAAGRDRPAGRVGYDMHEVLLPRGIVGGVAVPASAVMESATLESDRSMPGSEEILAIRVQTPDRDTQNNNTASSSGLERATVGSDLNANGDELTLVVSSIRMRCLLLPAGTA